MATNPDLKMLKMLTDPNLLYQVELAKFELDLTKSLSLEDVMGKYNKLISKYNNKFFEDVNKIFFHAANKDPSYFCNFNTKQKEVADKYLKQPPPACSLYDQQTFIHLAGVHNALVQHNVLKQQTASENQSKNTGHSLRK